jgi:propanol-preferring alcohol dehydrogenase
MKAMVLNNIVNIKENKRPLNLVSIQIPSPKDNEILVKISTCGVCHTEIDEIEGRTLPPSFPIIPGHQVVGYVEEKGENATKYNIGNRVGIAWIFSACGKCQYCLPGNENLCPDFKATGRDANGGYAEYMTIQENFAYIIPDTFTDLDAAPLLCAGAIGYRSLRLANVKDGQFIGLTGFGASAHLVLKLVKYKYPNTQIYVFARNEKEREFSKELGSVWAGDTIEESPQKLDSIIDTTPVWKPIIEALKNLKPGGRLIINAIRKEEVDKDCLLELDYPTHLWEEKEIKSVANVSRLDVSEFLNIAAEMQMKPEVEEFCLEEANRALVELKISKIRGAKVLSMN